VQRENIADLGLFEGLSKQLSAGDRHVKFLFVGAARCGVARAMTFSTP
jgi:hypothetical protein